MQGSLIRVSATTKQSLYGLKNHPRESFSDVIDRLVANYLDEEPLSMETLKAIRQARIDIRDGKFFTMEEAESELGLR